MYVEHGFGPNLEGVGNFLYLWFFRSYQTEANVRLTEDPEAGIVKSTINLDVGVLEEIAKQI